VTGIRAVPVSAMPALRQQPAGQPAWLVRASAAQRSWLARWTDMQAFRHYAPQGNPRGKAGYCMIFAMLRLAAPQDRQQPSTRKETEILFLWDDFGGENMNCTGARRLADLGDCGDQGGRARPLCRSFEENSRSGLTNRIGKSVRSPAGAEARSQVRQTPRPGIFRCA